MATPFSILPFRLSFIHGEELPFRDFYGDAQEQVDPVVKVVEYKKLFLKFESSRNDARLYMDGLDVIRTVQIKVDDEGDYYISPSNQLIPIYEDVEKDYPLIPGRYEIKVKVGDQTYNSLYKVEPKDLSEDQWKFMRDDLEKDMKGLAGDFVRKKLSLGRETESNGYLPPEQFFRFSVIKFHFPRVMIALNELLTKARCQVRKEYQLVPMDRVKQTDAITVRHLERRPDLKGHFMIPTNQVNYNLPENQWVCRIIRIVSSFLDEIISSIERQMEYELNSISKYAKNKELTGINKRPRDSVETLESHLEQARKVKNSIQIIKLASWYPSIDRNVHSSLPTAMMTDVRYRNIYQLYRDLISENRQNLIQNKYAYQWKRTDKLYELWAFIKMCKTLQDDLEFEPSSGWIYDNRFDEGQFFIPTLHSGTAISLVKNDIRLDLIYDKKIPLRSQPNANDALRLFTQGSNRPDGRIDVWKQDVYMGSVVFDVKYRKIRNFYDPYNRNDNNTNQLISYHSNTTSNEKLYIETNERPVPEVWAIHPTDDPFIDKHSSQEFEKDFDKRNHVRFIRACPGEGLSHIGDQLREVIISVISKGAAIKNMMEMKGSISI